MLIKRTLNRGDITLIDIRASDMQPGLLNTLRTEIRPLSSSSTQHTPSEEAIREGLCSLLVPSITAETWTSADVVDPVLSSNFARNSVAFRSVTFSGVLSGNSMSEDASGTVTLSPPQQYYPGARGKFSGAIRNFGRSCEISRVSTPDLSGGYCETLSYLPAGAQLGKVVFNVLNPFQGPDITACLTNDPNLQPLIHMTTVTGAIGMAVSPFTLTAGLTGLVSPTAYLINDFNTERLGGRLSAFFGDTFAYGNSVGWPTVHGQWQLGGGTRYHKYNYRGNTSIWGMKLVSDLATWGPPVSAEGTIEDNPRTDLWFQYAGRWDWTKFQGDTASAVFASTVATNQDFKVKFKFQQESAAETKTAFYLYGSAGQVYAKIGMNNGVLQYFNGSTWTNLIGGDPAVQSYDSKLHSLELNVASQNSTHFAVTLDGIYAGAGAYTTTKGAISGVAFCTNYHPVTEPTRWPWHNAHPYRTIIDSFFAFKTCELPISGSTYAGERLVLKDALGIIQNAAGGEMKTAVFYDGPRFDRGTKAAAFGGWTGTTNTNSVELFHFSSKTGSRKAGITLTSKKRETAVAFGETDAKCFVIGGASEGQPGQWSATRVNAADSVNSHADVCSAVYLSNAPLNAIRSGCASLDESSISYLVGGYTTFYYDVPNQNIFPWPISKLNRTTFTYSSTVANVNCARAGSAVAAAWPLDTCFLVAGGRKSGDQGVSDDVIKVMTATLTESIGVAKLPEPIESAGACPGVNAIVFAGGVDAAGDLNTLVTKYSVETGVPSVLCGSLITGGGAVATASGYDREAAWIFGGGTCPGHAAQHSPPTGVVGVSINKKSADCAQCVYLTLENRAGAGAAVI